MAIYIALNRTPDIDCYWGGAVPNLNRKPKQGAGEIFLEPSLAGHLKPHQVTRGFSRASRVFKANHPQYGAIGAVV